MQFKNKRIRLFFFLLLALALAAAAVTPSINVEPVFRTSAFSAAQSSFSSNAMLHHVMMTYMASALSLSSYGILLLVFLRFQISVHRLECAVPKQLRKICLRPIKFTSLFVALKPWML